MSLNKYKCKHHNKEYMSAATDSHAGGHSPQHASTATTLPPGMHVVHRPRAARHTPSHLGGTLDPASKIASTRSLSGSYMIRVSQVVQVSYVGTLQRPTQVQNKLLHHIIYGVYNSSPSYDKRRDVSVLDRGKRESVRCTDHGERSRQIFVESMIAPRTLLSPRERGGGWRAHASQR